MDIIEAHHKFVHAMERVVWEALKELENIAMGESLYVMDVHKQRQCKREQKNY